MKNIPLYAASFLAITGIGLGVTKLNEASNLKKEKAELLAKLTALEKSTQDALNSLKTAGIDLELIKENNARLQSERDAANKKVGELEKALANSRSAGGEDAAGNTAEHAQPGDVRSALRALAQRMDNPEMRKMMMSGQQRMVSRTYERLFADLKLSEDDSKLLAEMIAERNMTALDNGRKLLDGKENDPAAMEAVKKQIQLTKAEYDARIKAVVGGSKYQELSDYEQTIGDQQMLNFSNRNFERKDAPLQPQQKEALLTIMKEVRLKNPSNTIPDIGGGPGMAILMNESERKAQQQSEEAYQRQVIAKAPAAGLTPDQITILQDTFKQRAERNQRAALWGQSFFGVPGGR